MRLHMKWAVAAVALVVAPMAAMAQATCIPTWRWGSIGVNAFHCSGGVCILMMGNSNGVDLDFSGEPRLRGIDPGGPGAGKLVEGDVLVAVNGKLITSSAGGDELGNLPTDRDAELMVRRGDRLVAVTLRPRTSCVPPMLLHGDAVVESAPRARSVFEGTGTATYDLTKPFELSGGGTDHSLGITVRCSDCRSYVANRQFFWDLPNYPVVESVVRGGVGAEAGLRVGDEIRAVSGIDVRIIEGSRLLMMPPPGDYVIDIRRDRLSLRLRVNRRITQVEVTPSEPIRIRFVGHGDRSRYDAIIGTLVRWWRTVAEETGQAADLITTGPAFGPADLGLMVGSDKIAFSVDTVRKVQGWHFVGPLQVVEVLPGSAAERNGMRAGDVLITVNGLDVHTEAGSQALILAPRDRPLAFSFTRAGAPRVITIMPRG